MFHCDKHFPKYGHVIKHAYKFNLCKFYIDRKDYVVPSKYTCFLFYLKTEENATILKTEKLKYFLMYVIYNYKHTHTRTHM
jgi:hypothetical protein